MQITLKIEVQDELLETLNFLASALAHANGMKNTVKALKEIKETETEKIEEAPKEEVEDSKTLYTLDEVRAAFAALMKKGKKEELKAIITNHGVKNITSLKEEQFESVMKALGALK